MDSVADLFKRTKPGLERPRRPGWGWSAGPGRPPGARPTGGWSAGPGAPCRVLRRPGVVGRGPQIDTERIRCVIYSLVIPCDARWAASHRDTASEQETAYLLRSAVNARRLREAIARDKFGGQQREKEVDEHVAAGWVTVHDDADAFLGHLDQLDAQADNV